MPSMKLKDFQRLQKFMGMTTSTADGECLNAIRMANKVMAECGVTWEMFFKRTVGLEVEAAQPDPGGIEDSQQAAVTPRPSQADAAAKKARAERIDTAFRRVLDAVQPTGRAGDFRSFLLDLQAKWQEKGYLTSNQLEALFRAEARVLRENR